MHGKKEHYNIYNKIRFRFVSLQYSFTSLMKSVMDICDIFYGTKDLFNSVMYYIVKSKQIYAYDNITASWF